MNAFQRIDASNRAKLLQGHQSLQRTSESIARSHQIAAETDQIGVEIIDELGTQRETLLRTKDKVNVHFFNSFHLLFLRCLMIIIL